MEKIVYAVISKKKLHVFGSWSRRDKILQRANKLYKREMAHEVWEVTNAGIKTGDPYKSKTAERGWQPSPCGACHPIYGSYDMDLEKEYMRECV